MKRKIIACLLSITMLCSLLPMFALATSAEGAPTDTLSVTCPVCQSENCTEHAPCATCGEYNCTTDHSVMPASDPETCPECGNAIADCTCEPKVTACPTCGAENCELNHENWCDTCKKDNCGQDHSATPVDESGECESCGNNPCSCNNVPQTIDVSTFLNADTFEKLHSLMTVGETSNALSGLTSDELNQIKAKIDVLYEAVDHKDMDTEYAKTTLHKKIELIIANDDAKLDDYLAQCNCTPNKGVHASSCSAYIEFPKANVVEQDIEAVTAYEGLDKSQTYQKNLSFAMNFSTLIKENGEPDYTALQEAYFGEWIVDFVITTNKDITGSDAYIAGQYDAFDANNWVWINLPPEATLKANEPLQLIPMLTDWKIPFWGVVKFIKEFNCGIYVSDSYMAQNQDFVVTVEMRIYPNDTSELGYNPDIYHTLATIKYQQDATIAYSASAGGTVSNDADVAGTLTTPSGSTPTANENYHFAGWYTADENGQYTVPVPSEWVNAETGKLTPGTNANGTYDSATYYAKFDLNEIDVTVNVSGNTSGGSTGTTTGEAYLFVLSGTTFDGKEVELQFVAKAGEPLKIAGLPDGNYTVTPASGWNWRENVDSGTVNGTGNVDISSANNGENQWFSGCAQAKRTFG